jgi:sugar lactone lactonase YvrE
MSEVRVVAEMRNVIGEGPLWCPIDEVLYWLDIEGRRLYRLTPATGEVKEWATPVEIHALALRENHPGMIVTSRDGFGFFEPEAGTFEKIYDPEPDLANNWINDGKCDSGGRFWGGSLDHTQETVAGSLYRIDRDGSGQVMETGIQASNGIAWSLDDATMYHTDSTARAIYAYDFDVDSSAIRNRRVLVDTSDLKGVPDGLTIDAEGCLWSAFAFGRAVCRFTADGRLDRRIETSVPLTTSVMFGGPGLATLYITSGRHRVREEALARYPLSGSLFAVEPGVAGVPEPRFAG